ncbi:MAG: cyclic nucleotide-binding domain-containing protein [Chloroflexi bacterium]|nr:cyclic nucleotide-binding domain-containing protein [Chloroflexota bacterium]
MDLIDQLLRVPLFQQLPLEALQLLAGICDEREVRTGTVLARQADIGAHFHLISAGEAIVHRINDQGLRRPVGSLRAGDYFGVTSLFVGEPRDATVTASTDMRYWVISRAAFDGLLQSHPEIHSDLIIPADVLDKLRAPRYPWLNAGELVVYHCRRHILVLVQRLLPITLLFGLACALVIVPVTLGWLGSGLLRLLILLALAYATLVVWRVFDWRNDHFLVTTHRVTHRERVAFVYESREEIPIDRVQNINVERRFLGSVFGFGTLTIETAARMGKLLFAHIPHPDHMREIILQQLERARATRRAAERLAIRSELVSSLNLHAAPASVEGANNGEQPMVALSLAETPATEPGAFVRALNQLSELGFLPRTRIETEESITWRKHWLFLLREAMPPMLLGLLFGVLTVLGLFGLPTFLHDRASWFWLVTLGAAVVSLGRFWWGTADWANDEYIVTDERIIDIEKRPLFFSEQRREAPLGMIQNISLRMPNMLAAIFNYGDVVVQTAGSESFTFERVPNPSDVQREIFRRMDTYREAERQRESALRRAEMAEWFSIYQEVGGENTDGVTSLRPDGTWRVYTPNEGLSAGDVRALALTPDGSLWVGTNDGVSRRTRLGNWETLSVQDGLVSNDVQSIAVAPDGGVWFGTPQGVSRLSRHRIWQSFGARDGLASDVVTAVAVSADGTAWVGTDRGLTQITPRGEWYLIDSSSGLVHDHVLSLATSPDGSLWVGTWNGVSQRTADGDWEAYSRGSGLVSGMVLCTALAPDGSLWFGTNFGASRFQPATGQWESYTTRDGLPGNVVWSIAAARDGVVWFGTEAGAGRRLPDGLWRTYTRRDGLATDAIRVVAIATDGTVWFG